MRPELTGLDVGRCWPRDGRTLRIGETVSPSEKRSSEWPTEPEASTASGGHVTPDIDAGGPLFDPLFEPLPSERAGERGLAGAPSPDRATGEMTRREAPPAERKRAPRRDPRARRGAVARPRPGMRRVRRTIKRVDPWSVLKLSLFYYSIFLVFWLIFVAVFYNVIDGMGLFDAIEGFGQGFALDWGEIDISLMFVERWAFFIGLTLVITGALVNAFLAFLYNLGSDLVGGLEMTFTERDL